MSLVLGIFMQTKYYLTQKFDQQENAKLLQKKKTCELWTLQKKFLKLAIKAGGTTLQDFYQPDGNKGYFKIDLAVYDRAGKCCLFCKKEEITRIIQAQRATFFCKKCQS